MEVGSESQRCEENQNVSEFLTQNGRTLILSNELNWATNAVCKIKIDRGANNYSYGTGWACGKRLIITNCHVLDNVATCRQAVAQFYINDALIEVGLDPQSLYLFSPKIPNGQAPNGQQLDYAIVAVKEEKQLSPIWNQPIALQLWQGAAPTDVLLIGHPNGGEKQISTLGDSKVTAYSQYSLSYRNETNPGSSGSPVLAVLGGHLTPCGLHYSANAANQANKGILIDAIIADLQTNGGWGQMQAWQAPSPGSVINWNQAPTWTSLSGGEQQVKGFPICELSNDQFLWRANESLFRRSLTVSNANGREVCQLECDASEFYVKIPLQDGSIASVTSLGTVVVWDSQSGVKIREYPGEPYFGQSLQWGYPRLLASTAGYLVSTNEVGLIMVWAPSGRCQTKIRGHKKEVGSLLEIDNDRILTTSHDKTIRVWQFPEMQQKAVIKTAEKAQCVTTLLSAHFAYAAKDNVWVYNKEGQQQRTWMIPNFIVRGLGRCKNGDLLIRGANPSDKSANSCYQIWTPEGGQKAIIKDCAYALTELNDGSFVTIDYFVQDHVSKLRAVDKSGAILSNNHVIKQYPNDKKEPPYYYSLMTLSNGELLINESGSTQRWKFA